MQITYKELEDVLIKICKKANITRSKSGLDTLASIINHSINRVAFGDSFFYKFNYNISNEIKKDANAICNIRKGNLESMIQYLTDGALNYHEYINREEVSLSPVLESLEDYWYSYVRCNSGLPLIYKSPVRIYKKSDNMVINLRGGSGKIFSGEIDLVSQNVIALIKREDRSKNINLVFRVGNAVKPDLLQGVYSGISSNGDPICGKELLVRVSTIKKVNELNLDAGSYFSQLENRELKISDDLNADLFEESREQLELLFSYFGVYGECIIKIKDYVKFSWDDLRL